MPSNVKGRSQRLHKQVAEMSWAVPQVVNQRVSRLLLAGVQPSAKDQEEFQKMGAEKLAAFCESWAALGQQMWVAQQEMSATWMSSLNPWSVSPEGHWPANRMMHASQSALLGILGAGLAPVHRRAVGNARRLAKD
jgi:hypothetical protein